MAKLTIEVPAEELEKALEKSLPETEKEHQRSGLP